MFARILVVRCDQNDSHEINVNGYQARKINKIRNVSDKSGVEMLPKLST